MWAVLSYHNGWDLACFARSKQDAVTLAEEFNKDELEWSGHTHYEAYELTKIGD